MHILSGAVKSIQLNGSDGTKVEVVGNFDVVTQQATIAFPGTGTYYDNISGNTVTTSSLPATIMLAPGEYHVYSNTALKQ